ncbi:hypothetical protein FRX31_034457 [Thalictrum thalictroides]|uniref:Uncharacterized protein n=1 Tax=Thalictrum thalictroides TaxID=46969 RepID=A0A7J6UTQ0_THATH|nr:hypothetical protein FRX31_034457 [Thalictrum thalictroides]
MRLCGSRNNKHPDNNKSGNGGDKTQQNRDFKPFVMELTPLNTAYAVIYEHIKDKGLITPPPPLKESTKDTRDKSKRVSTLSRRQVKNAHRDKTKYLREYYYVNQLNFLEGLKVISYEDEPLCFTEKDLIGIFCPHNDALVITAWVAMWRVQRIMVDVGSSASVLFSNCYSQMQLAGD